MIVNAEYLFGVLWGAFNISTPSPTSFHACCSAILSPYSPVAADMEVHTFNSRTQEMVASVFEAIQGLTEGPCLENNSK